MATKFLMWQHSVLKCKVHESVIWNITCFEKQNNIKNKIIKGDYNDALLQPNHFTGLLACELFDNVR